MDNQLKTKINETVVQYKRIYPTEYYSFLESHAKKKDRQLNKFAAVADYKSSVNFERWNYDIPETLYHSLKLMLTDDEWTEFSSPKGTRWFMKNYKEFVGPAVI